MLAIERRQKIIAIIQENNKVIVNELAPMFLVTEETIRRDLEILESEGILKRTYGGAILNKGTNVDLHANMREIVNKDAKLKIAERVYEDIEEGDTIMLDSSSTALYVAKVLKNNKKKVTVITNSLKVAIELQDIKEFNLILAGGSLRESSRSFVGKWAESIIKNYYVNKAIICCKGLDINRGVMDSNEQEAEIKKLMTKSADKVSLVVDSMKFNKTSFVKIIDFSDIDYVYTDDVINSRWEKVFDENGIKANICK